MAVKKSRKRSGFAIFGSALIAVEKDEKFLIRYVKRVPSVKKGHTKGVPLL